MPTADLDGFSHRIVIKAEIIRAVAGLCVFKHYPVAVVGLTAHDCHTVIILGIQSQVLFINFRYFFLRS